MKKTAQATSKSSTILAPAALLRLLGSGAVIILALISVAPSVHAAPACVDLFAEKSSQPPRTWEGDLAVLRAAVDSRSRQPLAFKASPDRAGNQNGQSVRISTDPKDYARTKFQIRQQPEGALPPGSRLISGVEFGYELGDGFRRLGRANYFIIAEDGRVIEIGGGSNELLLEIQAHVDGRQLSNQSLRVIEEINGKILATLRADPRAQAKLAEFVKKRNWPQGIAEEAQLAYFSTSILPILDWAKAQGYSKKQLRDAGWLLMKFDESGRPNYQVNYNDSIKIPFFSDPRQSRVPVWRTRTLVDRNDGKKYLGWQTDRSIAREFTAAETLYNGWKLNQVRGKTLIITEGEFKCMIATKATGSLAVGIPGITQFDAKLAATIAAAQPKEVIVILDRDPVGKGLMRVDGITDSQRAAYSIAALLQLAGAKSVKVGTLPDALDGSKLGADDLILEKENGLAAFKDTVRQAVSPADYAKQISLDLNLHEKMSKRQALEKALSSYHNALTRGSQAVDAALVGRLEQELSAAKADFAQYIRSHYRGAKSINEPSSLFPSIRSDQSATYDTSAVAVRRSGDTVAASVFAKDILILDFVTADASKSSCLPGPCAQTEATQFEINEALSGRARGALVADLARAEKVVAEAAFSPATADDWSLTIIAGKLAHDFPTDEYQFDFNVTFGSSSGAGEQVPLVIYKKATGSAVALARLRVSPADLQKKPDLFMKVRRFIRK